RAGSEANGHPVLDQLRRGFRRDSLLLVGLAHGAALYPSRCIKCPTWEGEDLMHRVGFYARGEMDARIWISGPEGEPRSVALGAGRRMVGGDPEVAVQVGDEAVSWNHLEIENRGGVLMATDLDSRNGTALNGEPLDRPRRLRDGDTLIVGRHRLEVSDPVP